MENDDFFSVVDRAAEAAEELRFTTQQWMADMEDDTIPEESVERVNNMKKLLGLLTAMTAKHYGALVDQLNEIPTLQKEREVIGKAFAIF